MKLLSQDHCRTGPRTAGTSCRTAVPGPVQDWSQDRPGPAGIGSHLKPLQKPGATSNSSTPVSSSVAVSGLGPKSVPVPPCGRLRGTDGLAVIDGRAAVCLTFRLIPCGSRGSLDLSFRATRDRRLLPGQLEVTWAQAGPSGN